MDGLDEITASDETLVCEIKDHQIHTYRISPEQFGLKRCQKAELIGGTPQDNAQIALDVLNGKPGGAYTAVVMNAGAGLYIADKADSLAEGILLAQRLIDDKKALKKLEQFVRESNRKEEQNDIRGHS